MSNKPAILLQLDTDPEPCVFDAVTAIDGGAEQLLRHGGVTPENVATFIRGCIFTRGPADLHRTAVFIGGSDVAIAEATMAAARAVFVGPLRVSLMLDAGGCNTTASAAALCVQRYLDVSSAVCLVLGAGPVGLRTARLLAGLGATVRLGEATVEAASAGCDALRATLPEATLEPCATGDADGVAAALAGATAVVSAGPLGRNLVSAAALAGADALQVAVDLNAVPPAGIEGIAATDKAEQRGDVLCYGPLGVGGLKMKIHKAAIARLFTKNDLVLDAEEMLAIGREILAAK